MVTIILTKDERKTLERIAKDHGVPADEAVRVLIRSATRKPAEERQIEPAEVGHA